MMRPAVHHALLPVDMVGARQAARRQQHDEEQGGRREADDDRGQHQRLRDRIGVVRQVAGPRRSRIGAAPERSRPMLKMKRLTA